MSATNDFFKKYGFCEMYEWAEIPLVRHGLFVQFDHEDSDKIVPYHIDGSYLLGITTTCSTIISDDPDEWDHAYKANEVDDLYLNKEVLAVGIKQYDQHLEMSYIKTQPYEHYVKIPSDSFDKNASYSKRTSRKEWAKVNILGKVIVRDDGSCTPGSFCKPYVGNDKGFWGHAIPANDSDVNKFYVIKRITENTVMIINK